MEPQETILLVKILIISSEGLILTIRRSKTDTRKPLTWDLPGGFLNHGEDPTTAIIREANEESGIKIENPRVFHVTSFNDNKYGIRLYYYAHVLDTNVELSYEHDQYKWVTKEEFYELETVDEFKEAVRLLPKQV